MIKLCLEKTLLFSLALLFGCEEDLNLRDDFPQPFTLYGVLSPDLDTQYVRVYPVEEFPSLYPAESLDIAFTSTDLNTGERLVWQDTVELQPNGQRDLVFWAPFRAEFDGRYRVEAVRRNDGAMSSAEVKIPPPVSIHIEEPFSTEINEVDIHVFVDGEGIRVLKPEVVYTVRGTSGARERDTLRVTRTYYRREQPTETGWTFTIDFWQDRYWVQGEAMAELRCFSLALRRMTLYLIVGDAAWDPPGGSLDANLLVHPTVLHNVENGLGFVTGGYRVAIELKPSIETVERACLVYAL